MLTSMPSGEESLPADFVPKFPYLSAEFARLEKERLWPRMWLLACREEEVAKPGQFVTFDIADESIIVTRDNQNVLHAFFNVCQHRGRRLTEGCGRTASIFCKYHGWRWKLDGSNDVMIDGADWTEVGQEDVRLKDVRVDVWGGFVFVNIDGQAEPLLEYLKPWPEMWESYRIQDMRLTWFRTTRLDCNWKVALEAFIEGYHAQTAHRQNNPVNGGNLYNCRVFGRHSMFHDRDLKQLGEPNPNSNLLPGLDAERFATHDRRERIRLYLEQNQRDLDCMITDHMIRAARRLPERVEEDASYRDMMMALRDLHVEEAAKEGVSWDHLPVQDFIALGQDWHMFPNVAMLPTMDGLLGYRARPDGDDPDKCILDIFALERFAEGKAPKVERGSYAHWKDFKWPRIFVQDFENVPYVQAGMKSAGFSGAWTNPLAEKTIYNLHHELRRIVLGNER